MNLFLQVVLPVLLIFMAGFAVQKWRKLDVKSISSIAIYLLTPALVFKTFYKADLNHQYLILVFVLVILAALLIIINKIYCQIMKYSDAVESGLILSTVFMNAGNYGTPIILFAYGETGFNYAVTIMVIQSVMMNLIGVYYAARGQAGLKLALKKVAEMPATWCSILALLLNFCHVHVPSDLMEAVNFLSNATIPVVMLVLGMQLSEIKFQQLEWGKLSYGFILRLMISPLVTVIILIFLPVNPLLYKVLVILSAMPTAATTTMYAVQFYARPQLVSSITLITTLGSIITITALLAILR